MINKLIYSKTCLNRTLNKTETCLNRTLYKTESCINPTLNKVPNQEIFVKIICTNRTPVYSEHKGWSQGGSVQTGFIVFVLYLSVSDHHKKTIKLTYYSWLYIVCTSVNNLQKQKYVTSLISYSNRTTFWELKCVKLSLSSQKIKFFKY